MDFDDPKKVDCSVQDRVLFYRINYPVNEEDAHRLYEYGNMCFEKGKCDYVLIDLESSSNFSSAARRVWVEFLKNEKIKKTAIFGGNIFLKTLASFVIAATGKENIRFFSTEEGAREWLRSPEQ
jgi:hypothetical protein